MPGIKVEVKKGKKWWYVVADFGDGQPPTAKGPMSEAEATAIAAEFQQGSEDGVTVRDNSAEEAMKNRKVALSLFVTLGCVVAIGIMFVLAWVAQ